MNRILGLDPGSRHTGWGVIDAAGSRHHLVAQGTISCPARWALVDRIVRTCEALDEVVATHEPDIAVLESPFHGINSRSLIVLAQARGALLLALGRRGLAIEELTPAEIKRSVTGNGRADKGQVQRMVAVLLGAQDVDLSADAADALAVALAHAAIAPFRSAVARRRGPG